jgi:pyrroloquinoline-quinone synthase
MKQKANAWIDDLETLIQQKQMLSHPFYQAWMAGTLAPSTLQMYAKEYYQHVKAFPTYISALHSRCENPKIRKQLLTNLMDEEAGTPNHLDLWKSFASALGVNQTNLETHQPQQMTQELIDTFRKQCHSGSIVLGLAALYSYESQIPEICRTKIEGLKQWYGLTHPDSYRYFSVHETIDIEHSKEEKELLLTLVKKEEEEAVLAASDTTLNALWNFLSSFALDSCIS